MKKFFIISVILFVGILLIFFLYPFLYTSPNTDTEKTITLSIAFGHKNLSTNDCSQTLSVKRVLPYTQGVARAALEQLFSGPTLEEQQSGYTSVWGSNFSILKEISIVDRVAYVNLSDIRTSHAIISSSCGSIAALAQIKNTLTQFSNITDVRIAIEHNPQTFYDWTQIGCGFENAYCNPTQFLIASKNTWTSYTDPYEQFSISYPHMFISKKIKLSLPELKALYPAIQFQYTIPIQHCALSEICTPYTTNLSIQIASIPLSYTEIQSLLTKTLTPQPITLTQHSTSLQGFFVSMGAEGEGLYYYVFPLNKTQTLIITRSYIDEQTLISYRTAPLFIPFQDQAYIFENILTTLYIR